MLDNLRTIVARVVVHQLRRPRPLVVAAWLWLAAYADDVEEQRRCLNAVLQLDPDNETATLPLLLLEKRRPTGQLGCCAPPIASPQPSCYNLIEAPLPWFLAPTDTSASSLKAGPGPLIEN